jgi:hypothetical protein
MLIFARLFMHVRVGSIARARQAHYQKTVADQRAAG